MSEPGACSAVCGPGEAKRIVSCVQSKDGQDVKVDNSFCPEQIRPADSVPCVVDVCPIGWESKGQVLYRGYAQWNIVCVYILHNLTKHLCILCSSGNTAYKVIWFDAAL